MEVTSDPGALITTFTGATSAYFQFEGGAPTEPSYTTANGSVSANGDIAIVFTSDSGSTTIGLGQFQDIGGTSQMEMQMISGNGLLVTHWAYMLPYDPNIETPPPIEVKPETNVNPGYRWIAGTAWNMVDPSLFGDDSPGILVIEGNNGGYFWGSGAGPADSSVTFTALGSITPEGRVLFAVINDQDKVLTYAYGIIRGSNTNASMALEGYDNAKAEPNGSFTGLSQVSPDCCDSNNEDSGFDFYDAGTLVIGGNPVCPFNGSGAEEMELNNSQIPPVISGTGDFIGALGEVKTTRNEDLTYRHEFQLVGITQGTQLSVVSQTK